MISACSDAVTGLILAEESHLRRVARKLVDGDADVEDLVQDALLRAYRARDRFQPGTSIRAWTSTILRRVFLTDVLRAKRRGLETDTDAGEPISRTAGDAAPWTSESPISSEALAEQLEDPVKRALEQVPELYRTPFVMSVVEGFTYTEIATQLGVPEGTIMSRIHRARRRMQRDLGECEGHAVPSPRRATALRPNISAS